jgi:hypothetical protein
LVPVGTISAADVPSGLADFDVRATSDGPAENAEVVLGAARDRAGNVGTTAATCVVSHSQGASR